MRLVILCMMFFLFSTTVMGGPKQFKCPAVPKQEAVAIKKAGHYFAAGEKMAAQKFYKKSMERYLCSLKMKPHPNTMFNIAQVAKLIEDKDPILKQLKKFRNKNTEHPSVSEINQLIEKIEKGDFQSINPEAPPTEETAPELAAVSEPVAAPVVDTREIAPSDIPEEKPNRQMKRRRTAGILFIGGGVVFTGIGIGLAAASSSSKSKALSSEWTVDYDYYEQRYKGFAAGSVTLFIIGTACITTGVFLLIKSKKKKSETPKAALLRPSPLGLQISF